MDVIPFEKMGTSDMLEETMATLVNWSRKEVQDFPLEFSQSYVMPRIAISNIQHTVQTKI